MGHAYEEALRSQTLLAAADLSAAQYRFVKYNSTTRQAALASVAGERCRGVLQNTPAAVGRSAQVAFDGVSLVEAGEDDIDAGALIATDNVGRAALAGTAGDHVLGRAQAPSSAVGELIPVALGYEGVVPE